MTSAKAARLAAGLSVAEAAKRARVTPGYIRKVDAGMAAPFVLAERLAPLYGCPSNALLGSCRSTTPGGGTHNARAGSSRQAARPRGRAAR